MELTSSIFFIHFLLPLKVVQVHGGTAVSEHEFYILNTSRIDRQNRKILLAVFTLHRTWRHGGNKRIFLPAVRTDIKENEFNSAWSSRFYITHIFS